MWADLGLALGDARLEQLLDAWQALRDVLTGDTAVWNVRIVSWVPGSPIDWAAIIPTASPIPIISPVARLRP